MQSIVSRRLAKLLFLGARCCKTGGHRAGATAVPCHAPPWPLRSRCSRRPRHGGGCVPHCAVDTTLKKRKKKKKKEVVSRGRTGVQCCYRIRRASWPRKSVSSMLVGALAHERPAAAVPRNPQMALTIVQIVCGPFLQEFPNQHARHKHCCFKEKL